MKNNMKLLKRYLFTVAVMSLSLSVNAQHKVKPVKHLNVAQPKKAKMVARKTTNKDMYNKAIMVLRRTNHVVVEAKKAVEKNKVYSGDLSKAMHHQRMVKKMLNYNKMNKAMQHSRIAREYAFKSIKKNHGTPNPTFDFSKEEKKIMGQNTPDVELDTELRENNPSLVFNDENVSDKDMTDLQVLTTNPSEYKSE